MTPRHRLPGLEPLDRDFGKDRGNPIDRWYIHEFLWERRTDVRGRVLEVADSGYTDYLGEGQVAQVDVLHAKPGDPWATIVGDLATLPGVSQADAAKRLFAGAFGAANVETVAYGNVLVAAAFLYGYALEDLDEEELSHRDDDYHFLIGVRARRVD